MTAAAQSAPGDRLQFWEERERRSLHALPYVLLVVAVALDIASRGGLTGPGLIDLAIAAASLVWMVAIELVQRRDGGPTVQAAMFAVLIGLSAALVIRQPVYGFYSFTGYIWAFRTLSPNPRLRLVGLALVAMLSAIAQTGSGPYDSAGSIAMLAGVFLINAGVAGFFTWFAWVGQQQKDRRMRLIAELTEANERLAESLKRQRRAPGAARGQAREAGVGDERRRMAREIHDTLAQGLAGIITQLQAAERAGSGYGPGAKHLQAAVDLARESLSEARRSVEAMRPEPLDGARLPEAMQEVAARWSKLHGVPVAVTTTGTPRVMRPEIEVALLRTAQEALANVAKHADASRVGLTLSYMEDLVTLDVRDDGVGFDGAPELSRAQRVVQRAAGGFGLAAMQQRVEGVAGTLQIESEPEAGTAISASVPAIPAGAAHMSQPIKLLIVDDHPVVRNGLQRHVRRRARSSRSSARPETGAEAVTRAASLDPDVILMDLRMPEMDGVSAIARADRPRLARAGARAHHLRHRQRRAVGDRGRGDRLPAQGLAARPSCSGPCARPRAARRCCPRRSPPASSGRCGRRRPEPISQRELEVLELIARGARTARPRRGCSSARRRSRPT